MKMNHVWLRSLFMKPMFAMMISLSLTACVTVNVNFPESAVQNASDDYVKDLYREKAHGRNSSPTTTPTPVGQHTSGHFSLWMAEANAAEFNLESPKLEAIKASLKSRVPDIIEQKRAGVLGETNDGLISIHDPLKLKPLQAKKIQDLVKGENLDRQSLYQEVVRSNHLVPDHLAKVKESFSRSFQAESPSKTWVQAADGTWSQKP